MFPPHRWLDPTCQSQIANRKIANRQTPCGECLGITAAVDAESQVHTANLLRGSAGEPPQFGDTATISENLPPFTGSVFAIKNAAQPR